MASAMVVVSCAPGGTLLAQGPPIEHDPVGCVRAERFPRLTARLPEATGRARVYFRASGTTAWYFVEMKPEAGLYAAALPKPKKETKGFDYYIEALDSAMTQSRTADYSAAVVSGETCSDGKAMAAVASSARVLVGSPAGAPAVPAGFAGSGIVTAAGAAAGVAAGAAAGSAAGGASTGLIVGIAAAGAAGVGVAVASGGGGEDSQSGSGGQAATPSPSPGGSSTSGPIRLSVTYSPGMDVSACAGRELSLSGQTPIELSADGSFDVTGTLLTPNLIRYTGRATPTSLTATVTCASVSGPTGSLSASGSNYSMSGTFSFGNAAPTPNSASQGSISVTRMPNN